MFHVGIFAFMHGQTPLVINVSGTRLWGTSLNRNGAEAKARTRLPVCEGFKV